MQLYNIIIVNSSNDAIEQFITWNASSFLKHS